MQIHRSHPDSLNQNLRGVAWENCSLAKDLVGVFNHANIFLVMFFKDWSQMDNSCLILVISLCGIMFPVIFVLVFCINVFNFRLGVSVAEIMEWILYLIKWKQFLIRRADFFQPICQGSCGYWFVFIKLGQLLFFRTNSKNGTIQMGVLSAGMAF